MAVQRSRVKDRKTRRYLGGIHDLATHARVHQATSSAARALAGAGEHHVELRLLTASHGRRTDTRERALGEQIRRNLNSTSTSSARNEGRSFISAARADRAKDKPSRLFRRIQGAI
ncbi:hypothetical protein ACMYSQ_004627 [Aspergillus niger]